MKRLLTIAEMNATAQNFGLSVGTDIMGNQL